MAISCVRTRTFLVALLVGAASIALFPSQSSAQDSGRRGDDETDDIVVTTRRVPPGGVVGDILPDQSFSPGVIRSFGASSVDELVTSLSPQITSSRANVGPPVVLVNGWRVSNFAEIRDLPPEAIQRIDILPEDAALKYGFGSDQKVVNIVLRGKFKGLVVDMSAVPPLGTNASDISGQIGLTTIEQRNKRLNLTASYRIGGALYQRNSGIDPSLAGLGNILPGVDSPDGQIDPALSAAVGVPVLTAGVPASAVNGTPALADFIPLANRPRSIDQGAYRTLVGRTTRLLLNAAYAQPISKVVSATINGRIETTSTRNLLGVPQLSLVIPAGNPFSPFSRDVMLDRPVTTLRAREQRTSSTMLHLGSTFQGFWTNWRWTATASYDQLDSRTTTDSGILGTMLQARLDGGDPAFNPFATLDPSLTRFASPDLVVARTNTGALDMLVNGTVRGLPIGNVFLATRIGVQFSGYRGRSDRRAVVDASRIDRDVVNAQLSIDLPLVRKSGGRGGFPGDLSINGNARLDRLSDLGALTSVGAGLNWSPAEALRFIVSAAHRRNAPDLAALAGVAIVTPDVRTFDFTSGRVASVTATSMGNRNLRADTRDLLQVGVTLLPIPKSNLTLTLNYTDTRVHDATTTFLAATPAIEAAYPNNFVRNTQGNLTAIYYRPVPIARAALSDLRWGINWSIGFESRLQGELRKMRASGVNPLAGTNATGLFGSGSLATSLAGAAFASSRLQISLYHTIHLRNVLTLADGQTVDLLNGGAIEQIGGRPRHEFTGQVGYTRNGVGARASVDWIGPARIFTGPGLAGGTTFRPTTQLGIRLFVDLSSNISLIKKAPLLFGTRISLSVDNLLDTRRGLSGNAIPNALQSAVFDPSGRTIKLSIRKLFF